MKSTSEQINDSIMAKLMQGVREAKVSKELMKGLLQLMDWVDGEGTGDYTHVELMRICAELWNEVSDDDDMLKDLFVLLMIESKSLDK